MPIPATTRLVGQGVDVGAGFLNFFQECCLFEQVAGGLLESSIFNFLDDYLAFGSSQSALFFENARDRF